MFIHKKLNNAVNTVVKVTVNIVVKCTLYNFVVN